MAGDGEYDYDIYDEDFYADEDPYHVDDYNWDPYSTGEGSSVPIPKPRSRQQRRLDAARQQRRVDAAQGIINIHHDAYMVKEPCRTSALTAKEWLAELTVGHPKRMYQSFRMSKTNFFALCELLETRYGLEEGERISVQEQVAIFLWIVGQRANNRNAQERFQRSGETISRRFHNVLNSLNAMAIEWIKPWPWPRQEVHSKIRSNNRYYPHFAVIFCVNFPHFHFF
ncbi:hypothetical protein RHMOL_Rhmol12G0154100 [Rhododendron molle]|uniref:Uncharacterized protein n=1 Tax=Rhododendron molle TaxID=49168 RepID=A0ACC0LIC0_RHOML|nr:hypothetical protein RHMOL_Rhmol12G0154100 [Rhododendron molle]